MRNATKRLLGVTWFVGAILSPVTACTQRHLERDSIPVRDNCRLANQAITTGHPDPLYGWAVSQISFCEETGPAMLSTLWRRAVNEEPALGRLVHASGRFRDARLLDTIVAVLRNTSRPVEVRIAAMNVLVSYHTPSATPPPRPWPAAGEDTFMRCLKASGETHFTAVDGAQPFEGTLRPKIMAVLQAVGTESGLVGDAARCTAIALRE